MTRDEKRSILEEYQKIVNMIKSLDAEIEKNHEAIEDLKSKPSKINDIKLNDRLMENDSLKARREKFKRLARKKKEIALGYIDTVISVKHNRLLTEHYIRGVSWLKIDDPLFEELTDRRLMQLAGEALDMIEDVPAYTTLSGS